MFYTVVPVILRRGPRVEFFPK